MIRTIKISAFAIILLAFTSCMNGRESAPQQDDKSQLLVESVMTKEEQKALTPEEVISTLTEGNKRFVNNELTQRNYSKQVINSASGQYPEAIILSCVDSRVPVEDIFDRGIGDLFVARVAGNFVNKDILGSMEFACKVSGSKLVVVMGHNYCGAVRAAVDGVELGNITAMLQKIKPAITIVEYKGDKTSANAEYLAIVGESNVKNTINNIRESSPILKEMEDNGEIKIVGAVYNLENGKVEWLD